MKATVTVMLKPGVLDPQGKAIGHALHTLGFGAVGEVRAGKVIELELAESDPERARAAAEEMARKLLANTVIESYRVSVDGVARSGWKSPPPWRRTERCAATASGPPSMKAGIVIFPGINRERDMAIALRRSGAEPRMIWHQETDLAGLDLIVIPGGFSHGDYLRCGAMAAHSPVMAAVREHVARGGYLLGVCNGFQILTEAGLLPGALLRNASLRFLSMDAICASNAPTPSSPASTNAARYSAR